MRFGLFGEDGMIEAGLLVRFAGIMFCELMLWVL